MVCNCQSYLGPGHFHHRPLGKPCALNQSPLNLSSPMPASPTAHNRSSLSQCICLFWTCHINGAIHIWPLCLASFTQHSVFKAHPCYSTQSLPHSYFIFNWRILTILWRFPFKKFFSSGPLLKSLLNLLQYCFCFILGFWPWGMWDLSSQTPGLNPHLLHRKVKS